MPLYKECLQPLEEYIESRSGYTSVEFEIEKFDINSDAHPFIIGFITVKGDDDKEFEIKKDTVKSICIPIAMIGTDRNERGLKRMMSYHDHLKNGGDVYLDITKDRVRVFYNAELNKNAIAPPGD